MKATWYKITNGTACSLYLRTTGRGRNYGWPTLPETRGMVARFDDKSRAEQVAAQFGGVIEPYEQEYTNVYV